MGRWLQDATKVPAMLLPKFAIACGIAVVLGTVAGFEFPAESQTQDASATPSASVARSYSNAEVRLPSGKTVGRVFSVMTDSTGHAAGFEVRSATDSNAVFWLGAKEVHANGDVLIADIPIGNTVQIAAR